MGYLKLVDHPICKQSVWVFQNVKNYIFEISEDLWFINDIHSPNYLCFTNIHLTKFLVLIFSWFCVINFEACSFDRSARAPHMQTVICPTFTGKSLSEALIFASTNPQYDNSLFMELPWKSTDMFCPCSVCLGAQPVPCLWNSQANFWYDPKQFWGTPW